jgi:predicted RNA binding protein YcfA (HicA-like mRNA interferase family)
MILLGLLNLGDGSREPLDVFYQEFPEVFEARPAFVIDEDFVEVAVNHPEATPRRRIDSPDQLISLDHDQVDSDEIESVAEEFLSDHMPPPEWTPEVLTSLGNAGGQIPGGGHGGGILPWPKGGGVPPPDCLAFYLPIHFYYPNYWGVYLVLEGVLWLASYLLRRTGGGISKAEAIATARRFLYYHEAFHHKTECLSIRMEITHRVPVYKTAFVSHYQATSGTDDCLEEGLANAHALLSSRRCTGAIARALMKWVEESPPGYRLGVGLRDTFPEARNLFAEKNQQASFPSLPTKNPAAWGAATHVFDGINNIAGRVNYLVNKSSPLLARMRLRPLLPPRKAVRKLSSLAGITFKRPGGNHDIYQTPNGHCFPIPRHAKDLNRKVLRNILKQCGLKMGLEEFLRL